MVNKPRTASSGSRSMSKVAVAKKQSVLSSKKQSKNPIKSEEAYNVTMAEIEKLMKQGESNLSQKEFDRLRTLAEAAERYEDTHDPLPLPESLPEIIKMRMFQMQLKQNFAARLLGVSDAKFSLIMTGKQKPDVNFIKAIHDKLRVDANLILQAL